MHGPESQSAVPDDWFIDPVELGVPGARHRAEPADTGADDTDSDDTDVDDTDADDTDSGLAQPDASARSTIGAQPDATLAWQSDSLCAQTDPEAFFPEKGGSTRDAKKICLSCEVRAQCLDYALANDERFGIWGGLSERERRKLRKRA